MKIVFGFLALMLAGCASMNMSPGQIKAMADTQSTICFQGPGWNGGQVSLTYSTFGGKSTGTGGGGGTVKCGAAEVTFSNEGKVAKP